MIAIGEFSKICSVTTKTLRYYDEIGLIKPSVIAESGYRYYSIEQLKDMLLINRLKKYGFPLAEIAELMKDDNPDAWLQRLKAREKAVRKQLQDEALLLEKIQRDVQNLEKGVDLMDYMNNLDVKLIERADIEVLYTRQKMSVEEFGKYIGRLYERIGKDGLTVTGNVMSIYHDPDFNPSESDIEIAVPVKEVVTGTKTMQGGLHVTLVYEGGYSEIGGAYARLAEWMEKEGYERIRAPFEEYLTPPNAEVQKTQVYIPVKKVK